MSRLSRVLGDAYADVAQGEQFTRHVCDMARGIKKKAESAVALGESDFAGEYFLNPELFDLDGRPVTDAGANTAASLASFQSLITSGGALQDYARNWVAEVDNVRGDTGVIVTVGRELVINHNYPALNGIYHTLGPDTGKRVSDVNTAETLGFVTVKVLTGTLYTDTIWAEVLKINTIDVDPAVFVRQKAALPLPPGLSGATAAGGNYFDLVAAYGGFSSSAIGAAAAFGAAVTALKATTAPGATVAAATAVLALEATTIFAFSDVQSGIEAIEQFDKGFDFDNMIVTALVSMPADPLYDRSRIHKLIDYYLQRDTANAMDGVKEALQGATRKPFQMVDNYETGKLRDKTLNNNFTRSGGSPAGAMTGGSSKGVDAIASAFNDHNAMMEYWAQIGWQAAQHVNKNDPYVRQLEKQLRALDLEEIVTAHDKAVDNMLATELNISPADEVNLDLSPPPIDLPNIP